MSDARTRRNFSYLVRSTDLSEYAGPFGHGFGHVVEYQPSVFEEFLFRNVFGVGFPDEIPVKLGLGFAAGSPAQRHFLEPGHPSERARRTFDEQFLRAA